MDVHGLDMFVSIHPCPMIPKKRLITPHIPNIFHCGKYRGIAGLNTKMNKLINMLQNWSIWSHNASLSSSSSWSSSSSSSSSSPYITIIKFIMDQYRSSWPCCCGQSWLAWLADNLADYLHSATPLRHLVPCPDKHCFHHILDQKKAIMWWSLVVGCINSSQSSHNL